MYDHLAGRSILCVGTADWRGSLWTNQQHLMLRLARDNDVLFVESQGLRRPTVAARDLRRIARRVKRGLAGPRLIDGVWVVSPLVMPVHSSAALRRVNRTLLRMMLGRAMGRMSTAGPILWAYNPHAHELIDDLRPELVVYHCVDDIAAQEHIHEPSFAAAEHALVGRADLVLASAAPIADRMRSLGASRVRYLPNVADVEHFSAAADASEPLDMRALPRPRVLFAGAIVSKKLDVPLLVDLAAQRPDWSLVMVGPIGEGDPRGDLGPLRDMPNVHFVGRRSFEELPAWFAAADVCLIPYAVNRYTSSVFPMKVYEYLAAGRPVISTPLPALRGIEGVAFADGPADFEAAIQRVMKDDGPGARRRRAQLAGSHSWDARLAEIGRLVSECAS